MYLEKFPNNGSVECDGAVSFLPQFYYHKNSTPKRYRPLSNNNSLFFPSICLYVLLAEYVRIICKGRGIDPYWDIYTQVLPDNITATSVGDVVAALVIRDHLGHAAAIYARLTRFCIWHYHKRKTGTGLYFIFFSGKLVFRHRIIPLCLAQTILCRILEKGFDRILTLS